MRVNGTTRNMVPPTVAAATCRHPARRAGIVVRSYPQQSNQNVCHSDRSVSGVEESTTWDDEPPQDKICCLRRFLDSVSLARNDMPGGGFVLSTRVIFATVPAPRRGCSGDESSPLHCSVYRVLPFIRTGCICHVAGGRLPPLWRCTTFSHFLESKTVIDTLYIR